MGRVYLSPLKEEPGPCELEHNPEKNRMHKISRFRELFLPQVAEMQSPRPMDAADEIIL
jgi:hypothetical protein